MVRPDSDLRLLRDTAEKFLKDKAPVAAFRALHDGGGEAGYDPDLWASLAENGWLGVAVEEEHGGLGLGLEAAALLCEEMGRTLAASPFIPSAMMAPTALRHTRKQSVGADWLRRIADGQAIVVIGVDEGRKHDPTRLGTRATAIDGGWQLTGKKSFVAEGYGADAIVVAATDSKSEPVLLLVGGRTPGVAMSRIVALDNRNACQLQFEEVEVAHGALLARGDEARRVLDMTLEVGRIGTAAELLGIARETLSRTVEYVRQRKQFGRSIGSFQALQHRLAQLHCEIEVACSAVQAAARAADRDLASAGPLVALAKAKAEQVARLATAEAIQMHGGIGMTEELDLGLFLKRSRVAAELWGDYWFHADRFATFRGY